MKILILDDMKIRHEHIVSKLEGKHMIFDAYTVDEAIDFLDEFSPFDMVFLDHDLGGKVFFASDEKSGYAVAKHIANMEDSIKPKEVIVHSLNPVGAKRMTDVMRDASIKATQMPVTML